MLSALKKVREERRRAAAEGEPAAAAEAGLAAVAEAGSMAAAEAEPAAEVRSPPLIERVEDVFFVTTSDGNSISDAQTLELLEDAIKRALDTELQSTS